MKPANLDICLSQNRVRHTCASPPLKSPKPADNQKNNKILDNFFCKLKLINLLAKGLCQSRVLKLALDKEL